MTGVERRIAILRSRLGSIAAAAALTKRLAVARDGTTGRGFHTLRNGFGEKLKDSIALAFETSWPRNDTTTFHNAVRAMRHGTTGRDVRRWMRLVGASGTPVRCLAQAKDVGNIGNAVRDSVFPLPVFAIRIDCGHPSLGRSSLDVA